MLRLLGIRHGAFAAVEAFNPRFVPGAPKLCLTIDTDPRPVPSQRVLVARLVDGFPGLAKHECRVRAPGAPVLAGGTQILMLPDDPGANQAHLFEHLLIELLAVLAPARRRAGVTCAWRVPPERNDVFVECPDPALGGAAATLALAAMDCALAGRPLSPLFADLARVWTVLAHATDGPLTRGRLERESGLRRLRMDRALELLAGAGFVRNEPFALELDGGPGGAAR